MLTREMDQWLRLADDSRPGGHLVGAEHRERTAGIGIQAPDLNLCPLHVGRDLGESRGSKADAKCRPLIHGKLTQSVLDSLIAGGERNQSGLALLAESHVPDIGGSITSGAAV